MCGICGIYNYANKAPVKRSLLKRMNDALSARGPDAEGLFVQDNIGLANKRLAIIDVAGGSQPIFNEKGTVCLVYNGEIYNYLELKKALQEKGHRFKTATDSEVIVHLYEEYQEDCCRMLEGMFAFALWDAGREKLILARDRFGIKPLVYSDYQGRIIFASETKALVQDETLAREIDFQALDYYLTYLAVPSPLAIYKGIKKLPPATMLICRKKTRQKKSYWQLRPKTLKLKRVEEYGDLFYALLKDSVRARMVSDVPLGAFLSGGIDSSSVVGLMAQVSSQPVRTFSIGFKEKGYNELAFSRLVAQRFSTRHHELLMQPDDLGRIEDLIWNLDEPHANSSALASYLVARLAARQVKAALTGVGADELFGGYRAYIADKLGRYYSVLPGALIKNIFACLLPEKKADTQAPGILRKTYRFVNAAHLPFSQRHTRWMSLFGFDARQKQSLYSDFLKEQTQDADSDKVTAEYFAQASQLGLDYLNQAMYADLNTYLNNDVLQQVDRMSMASSLEARVPFLDRRLVEFAFSVPSGLKVKGFGLKYLLRKSMRGLLGDQVVNRQKHGFGVPLAEWFQSRLIRDYSDRFLSREALKKRGFFRPEYVQTLIREHRQKSADHSHRLWSILVLELWCRRFLG